MDILTKTLYFQLTCCQLKIRILLYMVEVSLATRVVTANFVHNSVTCKLKRKKSKGVAGQAAEYHFFVPFENEKQLIM